MAERTLLTSNDHSITLTTHRLVQKTAELNQEIELKDFLSYEVIKKRHKYYLFLQLLFGIPMLVLFVMYLTNKGPFERAQLLFNDVYIQRQNEQMIVLLIVIFVLTLISTFLYFTSAEKQLKVTGKHNSVLFSLRFLKKESLNKFLNQLEVEVRNRKSEIQ